MPVYEDTTNTETNSMYELLRELQINLALLDWKSTEQIMTEKLDRQVKKK